MSSIQLGLFPDCGENLDTAIQTIVHCGIQHSHFECFVREVTTKALRQRQGNLILCAAPADIACEELIVSISDRLKQEHEAITGTAFAGVSVDDTPSGFRRKPGAASILESYHAAAETPGVHHRRPPEYQLDFGSAIRAQNQFEQISGLLQRRLPSVYIMKNAHLLQSFGSGTAAAVDALLMLAQLANTSRRTHILIGHTKIVLDWLRLASVAGATSSCVLAPYDPNIELDRVNFTEIVRAYDRNIPWEDGESLERHMVEINQVISGCPHRLRKWLTQALCKARAENEGVLTWNRMMSARLLPAEQTEAGKELTSVREFNSGVPSQPDLGDSDTGERPAPSKKTRNPPGIRNPNRNGIQAA